MYVYILPPPGHTYPDITLARKKAFRDARSIEGGACDIEAGHQHQPADLPYGGGLQESLRDDIVQGRNDSTQAKAQKYSWQSQE